MCCRTNKPFLLLVLAGLFLTICWGRSRTGSGRSQRLTFFADYPGYKASNPVVSDDGRYMAFQFAKKGDRAGVGRGIFVFDLVMYEGVPQTQ